MSLFDQFTWHSFISAIPFDRFLWHLFVSASLSIGFYGVYSSLWARSISLHGILSFRRSLWVDFFGTYSSRRIFRLVCMAFICLDKFLRSIYTECGCFRELFRSVCRVLITRIRAVAIEYFNRRSAGCLFISRNFSIDLHGIYSSRESVAIGLHGICLPRRVFRSVCMAFIHLGELLRSVGTFVRPDEVWRSVCMACIHPGELFRPVCITIIRRDELVRSVCMVFIRLGESFDRFAWHLFIPASSFDRLAHLFAPTRSDDRFAWHVFIPVSYFGRFASPLFVATS